VVVIANNFSRADLEQERTIMKKILTIVAVTTSLIGGANFAFAAATDSGIHTDKNDGCTYQGYSCSDWQQQNGN
jgi:Spy/CpxP family protein refolding chaperone